MRCEGAVFDFNGTLYWDTDIQNESWDIFLSRYGFSLSDREKELLIHGRNGADSFSAIFSRKLSGAEVEAFTDEKEGIYRELCSGTRMELAPGAVEFLEFLGYEGIPHAIATASGKDNVDFFFEAFRLDKYFSRAAVVLNDGTIRGKPHPDIFLKAIDVLGLDAGRIVVFEDSDAGIQAAEGASAGRIIIVDSHGADYGRFLYQRIRNFVDVDRDIFK